MSKKEYTGKDHIGQEIRLGDWAAITQNNMVHVGKIISISKSGAPTIARDSVEEFAFGSSEYKKLNSNWKTYKKARDFIKNKFPNHSGFVRLCSWCRDTKFVKINPTNEMLIKYDV